MPEGSYPHVAQRRAMNATLAFGATRECYRPLRSLLAFPDGDAAIYRVAHHYGMAFGRSFRRREEAARVYQADMADCGYSATFVYSSHMRRCAPAAGSPISLLGRVIMMPFIFANMLLARRCFMLVPPLS